MRTSQIEDIQGSGGSRADGPAGVPKLRLTRSKRATQPVSRVSFCYARLDGHTRSTEQTFSATPKLKE
jgi:hypothetical protein